MTCCLFNTSDLDFYTQNNRTIVNRSLLWTKRNKKNSSHWINIACSTKDILFSCSYMISCYAGHCVKSSSKHLHRASDKIIHSIRQENIHYESILLVLVFPKLGSQKINKGNFRCWKYLRRLKPGNLVQDQL